MGTTPLHQPRSSDRVGLIVQLQIYGSDVEGRAYCDMAQTLEVSRNGALILTNRNLTPQDEVLIRCQTTGKESPAQIVGQVRKDPGGFVYGVKLLDPNVDLWDITFVPMTEEERAVLRTLLECAKCRLREVVYLEEFETEVYQAHRYIYHFCERCRESTIWNEAAYEATERKSEVHSPTPAPAPTPEPGPAPRTRNERRHNRINCKFRACIRYKQHFQEEILEVNDVSRGGVSFTTRKYLAPGTKLDIAIPYSPGMANIFVPGEVVRLTPIPDKHSYDCGVAYLKQ